MHPAEYWKTVGEFIHCELCPHRCRIRDGQVGRCGVRRHVAGTLVAEAYGLVSGQGLDPVEKKPLFHVKPGREILSLGSGGCNFLCPFCQNWTISQSVPPMAPLSPEQAARAAVVQKACGVAYTYNEPLINFEYVRDCAREVRRAGLLNVMVTNGYVNPEPLQALLPWIDAWNIDVKSIRPEFYRRFCGGELQPVLDTVAAAAKVAHVELTHLIVTDANDRESELEDLVCWVASVSPEIPVHFSRYFPQYQWEAPATAQQIMQSALVIGRRHLSWVYAGNLAGQDDSTYCPDCGNRLIPRQGYLSGAVKVADGRCPQCARRVPGIF
jgi:pyruvate formate lyase activating enzyme